VDYCSFSCVLKDECSSSACLLLSLFPAPAAPAISSLSLHDALPIYNRLVFGTAGAGRKNSGPVVLRHLLIRFVEHGFRSRVPEQDRKSTRLNSSHVSISYAVFCLKKKFTKMNSRLLPRPFSVMLLDK